MTFSVEMGRISKQVNVPEITIRGVPLDDECEEETCEERLEYRLEGCIVNGTGKCLSGLVYDLSYYAMDGSFLGLDKSGALDTDEMDPHDRLPISMELNIPSGADRLVFNVRATTAGCITKLLWG